MSPAKTAAKIATTFNLSILILKDFTFDVFAALKQYKITISKANT
jgi:hypothetical protein